MAEPAGIFGAFEPATIPHAPAQAPPKYDFGLDTLGAGWKGGSAGTDYGLNQAAYTGDIMDHIQAEANKRGIETPGYTFPYDVYDRRVKAAGGRLDVLSPLERATYDRVNNFWVRIAEERKKDPSFLKDYAGVWDMSSLQNEAKRRRAIDEEAANDVYARSTRGGKAAYWIGSLGTASKDPLSYFPLGATAKVETTVGGAILRAIGTGAVTNAAVTAALEPAIRIDAAARGQDRTLKDTAIDVALSAAFGGVLEGTAAGISRKLAPDERAASHVVTRDAEVRASSPFERTPAGDTEHGTRLAAAMAALEAGQPVPKFKTRLQAGTSLAGGAERFKAMVRAAESSGDDAARPIDPKTGKPLSTAVGRFQFTRDTWLIYYKREIGAQGLTDAQILAKRTDGALQERLMDALTKDNQAMLRAVGLPDSPTNLYMVHFLGPKGMRVLRADPNTPVAELLPAKFIKANQKALKDKTAGEVIAWADRKMGGEGVVLEMPDAPTLREDIFVDEGEYRGALAQEAAPESGPDFALRSDDLETVYRGESTANKEGSYFSTDREWARNFTQSGRDEEIAERLIGKRDIYEPDILPLATKVEQIDKALAEARERGFKAIRVDEGEGEPNSVFVFDQSALKEPSLTAFHGSPQADLTSILANPPTRQFDNATSQFGAYFSPTEAGAKRYAGETGHIYRTELGLKNPYQMDWSEFAYFQAPNKAKDGGPAVDWGARNQELIEEAAELRQRLQAAGYDGIIVRGSRGDVKEIASFNDVRLATPEDVVRQVEAEGPRFDDPAGPDAIAQTDSTLHDLTAEDLGPDLTQFRIAEEGREITIADALEGIARDEAAIKAVKDCL